MNTVADALTRIAEEWGCVATQTGLRIPPEMPLEDYLKLSEALLIPANKVEAACPWWIGDFVIHGDDRYGETYAQALSMTDFSKGSLVRYAYVARNVPPENRNPEYPHSFHYLVARLPVKDQQKALKLANGCTTHEFNLLLREKHPSETTRGRPRTPKPTFDSWAERYFVDHKLTMDDKEDALTFVSDRIVTMLRDAFEAGR